MKHYVYKITNTVNKKVYIGKSKNPITRFAKHVSVSKHKIKSQYFYLQRAINKYGEDKFVIDILEEHDSAEAAYAREIYWISFYKSCDKKYGMNLTKGGDGSPGHVVSVDARSKISAAQKGRTMPAH